MSLNDKLLKAEAAAGALVPSEHFGVMLYEGDDKSGHSINGGKYGGAAAFGIEKETTQSTDSRITTTYYAKNVGSISGWFKKNGNTSELEYIFVTKDDTGSAHQLGINLLQEADSDLSARVGNGSSTTNVNTSGLTLNNDAWHHYVVTWNLPNSTNNVKVYVNGSLSSTGSQSTGSWTGNSSRTFQLGHYTNTNTNNGFAGMQDQVRVFEKELSASEVSTLYAETANTVESLDPLSEDTTDTLQVLGDSSCVATYRFENDETDLSGNYNGTGTEIQYAAGRYGQAASFNGSSSYVSGNVAHGDDYSVSAWVYPESHGYQIFYQARQDSANLTQVGQDTTGGNGTLSIANKANNVWTVFYTTSEPLATLNQWYHIVVNFTSSDAKIYVNGSFVESHNAYTSTPNYSAYNIGATNTTSYNGYWDGKIDQLRLFNKALSASEVTTLYEENSLVASYRFEGNSIDDTRNNDGSDSNMTYEFGLNFTPDFVWIKNRSSARGHNIFDSTRGVNKVLFSNSTSDEGSESAGTSLSSFDTGGFTVGSGNGVNEDGDDFVAWCWKANGGTTSSNTDGSITSTVQANTDAGFSICKWNGGTAEHSVGHGLGVKPELVIVKELSGSYNWNVYYDVVDGSLDFARLNLSDAGGNSSRTMWTSSVFYWSGNHTSDVIAYAFHSVDNFSKFGSYTGTGSATDRPIIETGFEPAFVMIKSTSTGGSTPYHWNIYDNKRNKTNPRNLILEADTSDADLTASTTYIDFLSNGFQIGPTTSGRNNGSGVTYIYMAFAADPDTEAPTLAKSFSTVTYSGTGANQSIDGLNFKPGFVWLKNRDQNAYAPRIFDIVRGATKRLQSSTTAAESTDSTSLTSFDTSGFSLGSDNYVNNSGDDFVAWSWAADDNEPTIFGGPAVAVYKFEDNANDVAGTYNGTASNVSYATGNFNKAAVFNGSSSGVDIGNLGIGGAAARTISAWVYVDSLSSAQTIFQHGNNSNGQRFGFAIDTAGKVYVEFYNRDAITSSAHISVNTWYHLVATYNGGAIQTTENTQIYVDGVAVAMSNSGAQTGSANTGDANYGIGYDRLNTRQYFDGKIDQVRIYRGALGQDEVSELYAETVSNNDDLSLGGLPEIIISANANAGFSIAKYEGTGVTQAKVPHGLSATPELVIIKSLETTDEWQVFGNTIFDRMQLNNTGADDGNYPLSYSSTNITLPNLNDNAWNGADKQYIMYCFHSVSGYSKIGSYAGNGTTQTINVGFQPDWIMIKAYTNGTAYTSWTIIDSVRYGSSSDTNPLYANLNAAEGTRGNGSGDGDVLEISFTSTGFKLGDSGSNNASDEMNDANNDYIYMAFKIN